MDQTLAAAIARGNKEHYADPLLYDHDYRRRRADVNYYVGVAKKLRADRVLELGCGTGRITVPLLRDGREVVGVDAAPRMLAAAKARIGKLPPKIAARAQIIGGDFCDLTLPAGRDGAPKFPLVICPFNAFQHLYDRTMVEAFLDGVRRHLQPGGWLVFDLLMPDLKWLSRDPDKRWARTRFKHPATGVPMVYSTSHYYDEGKQICFMKIFYEPLVAGTAPSRTVSLTHRYFYPEELRALLHYNGFVVEKHFRDFDEVDYDDAGGGDQQVLWCRRDLHRVAPHAAPTPDHKKRRAPRR